MWGVATNPTGTLLASASDDKTVIVWQFDASSKDTNEDGRYRLLTLVGGTQQTSCNTIFSGIQSEAVEACVDALGLP